MTPLWSVMPGDARATGLAAESVHCCVTSPPYWQLRRYQGAGEGCIGEEATVELYLEHLLEVFREVRRVLRRDGVLWVNIGDSRINSPGNGRGGGEQMEGGLPHYSSGAKPGVSLNLAGIPERFALAMQAAGWVWRDTICWAKAAPMPESVQGTRWERCRVKVGDNGRGVEAQRIGAMPERPQQDHNGKDFAPSATWADCPGCAKCRDTDGLVLRRGSWRCTDAWEHIFMFVKGPGYWADGEDVKTAHLYDGRQATKAPLGDRGDYEQGMDGHERWPGSGANRRNVWSDLSRETSVPGHYAQFPPSLPARCIQASTSDCGCCPRCGAQWARVVDRTPGLIRGGSWSDELGHESQHRERQNGETRTLGYRTTCKCPPADPVPATVLDPFCGVGSTLLAAARLGRCGIGVEISPDYCALARARLENRTPWF